MILMVASGTENSTLAAVKRGIRSRLTVNSSPGSVSLSLTIGMSKQLLEDWLLRTRKLGNGLMKSSISVGMRGIITQLK